jgi:uncharacterized BrkB/YihY/UPF0761 family membrane protein
MEESGDGFKWFSLCMMVMIVCGAINAMVQNKTRQDLVRFAIECGYVQDTQGHWVKLEKE